MTNKFFVIFNLFLAAFHLAVDELHFFQDILLKFRILGFNQEGKYLVIIAFDESGLVLIDNANIGLIGSDHFGEEPIIRNDIFFQFPVDYFQTGFVVGLCFLLHAHDGVYGVDQLVFEVTGCLQVYYPL